ncbi:MAG: SusC/RagA family TonB-linked outer membrane protein [Saprospiraceae bacterium]|nr:SusC/RagA family TonB-linked outer membrane protein [Saprospiraceae bacterium]
MKQLVFTLFILFCGTGFLSAQRTISGTVSDEAGVRLIGANVIAKNSTEVGTITDVDGAFSLKVPSGTQILVVSYTGYESREVTLGTSDVVNITLSEGRLLEEVVVTALGIKRDKSNLGYSVGQITSNELVTGRTTNVTNALVGKVAGVRVSGSGGSFTGSGIIVRGFTTFLGSNQPLYVVDGIPIDNSGGGTPLQTGSSLSNRAIDLNQEDIENISVLKGAGATTLYGSRGAAGVILITTKKGKKNQKNSITYTANYASQEVNRIPDYQNTYGQGTGGAFNATAISSWGPKIDGRKVTLPSDYRAAGIGDSVALTAYPKNVEELFRKGFNMQHNLSFQGGSDKSTYRLSMGYLQDQGVFDNNRLNRYNVGLNAAQDITSKLNAAVSINYSSNSSKRTLQGNQLSNPLFRSWFTPRSWDLTGLPWQTATGAQLHYDPAVDNPRWSIYNNLNDDNTDRILGNVNLTYKMNSWLTANYKIGVDNFTFATKSYDQIGIRGGGSTSNGPTGAIRETSDIVRNINSYLSLSAAKHLNEDFEVMGVVGHEVINERRDAYSLIGRGLIVPGLRNLSTNTTAFTPAYGLSKRRIVGVFGNLTTIYKNFATVDVSLRNDWNSTLPITANSYLYYSFAGTLNLDRSFSTLKSNTVNLLKLEGNFGRTGKGEISYMLQILIMVQLVELMDLVRLLYFHLTH